MAVPTTVLWERDPHTAAKHTLLKRYLMAWFPIMAKQFRTEGITFLDGFAGPGEYLNSHESSPAIAMAQAHRREVVEQQTPVRLVFIEDDKRRAEHLAALLDRDYPPAERPTRLTVQVHHGKVAALYDEAVTAVGGWKGPVFANLDGWGVDTDYPIVQRIGKQQSSEVLVTFKDQFFTRFAEVEEQEAGDRVFGGRAWREVAKQPTPNKKPFLLDLYRQRLREAGFGFISTFEMLDEGGNALYLFFGTTSIVAVEKFKDGLWEVDGIAGQRFRDPRNPDQLFFDISQPDFSSLQKAFLDLAEHRGEVSLETLGDHALRETMFKRSHAKPTVDRLVEQRRLEPVRTGKSYAERMYKLATPSLF